MRERFLMVTKGCAINKGLGNFAATLFHTLVLQLSEIFSQLGV